jgi:ADP-ribose pyrophosphatase YjhB (NUDIX family)
MQKDQDSQDWMDVAMEGFMPHISLDCVVFGFHAGELKILLLKMKLDDRKALPGGFVRNDETLETAAIRTLRERTGLEHIFLQQFHVFSDPRRSEWGMQQSDFARIGINAENAAWFAQRFISVGFYALVEYSKVDPRPDAFSESCEWYTLEQRGELVLDHDQILLGALAALRSQINTQPIGYSLLPRKFTMPELQKLYETILGRKLDRRNFQRKILSYGILRSLDEKRKGVAHKAPYLYSFDVRKYQKALRSGLGGGVW